MWKALNFRVGIPPIQEVYFQNLSSAILAVGSQETNTGFYLAVVRDTQEWITETSIHH